MNSDTLPDQWSLYAHYPSDSFTYRTSYRHVMDVNSTLEWGQMVQYVPGAQFFVSPASLMLHGREVVAFSFFRASTPPEWEHPNNSGGSVLTGRLRLSQQEAKAFWEELLCEFARGAVDAMGFQLAKRWHRGVPSLKLAVWLAQGALPELIIEHFRVWGQAWNLHLQ
jgi:hypothetical protein